MSIFSSGSIIALSGLIETLVFSPLDLTLIGLEIISAPVANLTLHLPPEISITSPAKVLVSPINSATNEFTGSSYSLSGLDNC